MLCTQKAGAESGQAFMRKWRSSFHIEYQNTLVHKGSRRSNSDKKYIFTGIFAYFLFSQVRVQAPQGQYLLYSSVYVWHRRRRGRVGRERRRREMPCLKRPKTNEDSCCRI